MEAKIIVAGYLSKSEWGGRYQSREQDFVISEDGIYMSIPSTYSRHPFNVLVTSKFEWKSKNEKEQQIPHD